MPLVYLVNTESWAKHRWSPMMTCRHFHWTYLQEAKAPLSIDVLPISLRLTFGGHLSLLRPFVLWQPLWLSKTANFQSNLFLTRDIRLTLNSLFGSRRVRKHWFLPLAGLLSLPRWVIFSAFGACLSWPFFYCQLTCLSATARIARHHWQPSRGFAFFWPHLLYFSSYFPVFTFKVSSMDSGSEPPYFSTSLPRTFIWSQDALRFCSSFQIITVCPNLATCFE